jgi:hypothetical protein
MGHLDSTCTQPHRALHGLRAGRVHQRDPAPPALAVRCRLVRCLRCMGTQSEEEEGGGVVSGLSARETKGDT